MHFKRYAYKNKFEVTSFHLSLAGGGLQTNMRVSVVQLRGFAQQLNIF